MPDQQPSEQHTPELEALRARIDSLDARLVELLNERAGLVVEVGALKRGSGVPIYAPHREAAVLKKVLGLSKGPLSQRTIEAIWRELMSGSFALEQPLRIGYLGPAGSYSHQAAVKHFGSSVSFEDVQTVAGVFNEVVRAHCDYGLAPIENSIGGGITETMDAFRDHAGKVNIYAEALLAVHHCLLANCEPGRIRRIHSKPEVFAQCRQFLQAQYPQADLIAAASSSRAVQTAKAEEMLEPGRGSAAIGSALAGQLNGVNILFEDIEDDPNNVTRFFILSRQSARRSGRDKTSIMFSTADKHGALVDVLRVFDEAGVNLTHIDKRPSRRENWSYTFFIDCQGHRDDEAVAAAITEATTHCHELRVLGSYPAAERVL